MGTMSFSKGYIKYSLGRWQNYGVNVIHPLLAGMASFIRIRYWRETGTCSV